MIDKPDLHPFDWLFDAVCIIGAGSAWPEGDEDTMRDLSKAWRDLADQMNHALTAGDTAAMQIITAWGGDAGNAFSEYWDAIAVGPDSGLPAVMDNAQNLADLVDDAAMQIEYAKLVLVITLVITVITLIVCQILAFFTGGASEAAAAAEVAAAREVATTIFQQLMRWILRVLVKKVLVKFVLHEVQMVVAQVGADYLAQKIQFEEGTRTQWNPDWFKTDLVSALITGAVTFPMSLVHLPVKSTAGKYAANAAFHGVTNGLVMPASMVLTNHALTGEWNTDDITWKTFVYSGINGAGMSLAGTGLHDLTTGKDGANPTRVLTDPTALSGDHPTTTVDDVTLAGAQTTLGDPHVLGTSPRDVPTGTGGDHDTTVVVPSGGSHTDPVTLAGGPHTDVAPHPDVTAPVDTPAPPAGDPPAGAPPAGPPAEPNGPAASGPAGDHPSIIPPGDNPSGGSVTLPSDTARPDQAAVVQPSTAQPHDTGNPTGTPPADAPRGAVVVPVGPDTTVRPEVSAPVHGQDGGPTVVSRPDAGGPPSGVDRTAQGGPGGDGPAAVILPDGPRPDVTARPDLTARPDAGARPDLTARPDGGGRPDATSRPDATARPDSTARPDPAARPDATTRADGTRGVDDTARGGADGGSGTTVRPDGTDGAARPDGGGPDAGTRPDGAGGHDGAAHPDRDGGVGTHPESGEPAQPVVIGPDYSAGPRDPGPVATGDRPGVRAPDGETARGTRSYGGAPERVSAPADTPAGRRAVVDASRGLADAARDGSGGPRDESARGAQPTRSDRAPDATPRPDQAARPDQTARTDQTARPEPGARGPGDPAGRDPGDRTTGTHPDGDAGPGGGRDHGQPDGQQAAQPPTDLGTRYPHPPVDDARPYGTQLARVPEHYQRTLEDAIPTGPDGRPQTQGTLRSGTGSSDWADAINDGGPGEPGRSNNCPDTSLAFLATHYGDPTVAAAMLDPTAPGERGGSDRIAAWTGGEWEANGRGVPGLEDVATRLRDSGPGSAAVIVVEWPDGGSHAFNAVNEGGHVVWYDAQTRAISTDTPLHQRADGVWSIVMDAEGNPLNPRVDLTAAGHDPSAAAGSRPDGTQAGRPPSDLRVRDGAGDGLPRDERPAQSARPPSDLRTPTDPRVPDGEPRPASPDEPAPATRGTEPTAGPRDDTAAPRDPSAGPRDGSPAHVTTGEPGTHDPLRTDHETAPAGQDHGAPAGHEPTGHEPTGHEPTGHEALAGHGVPQDPGGAARTPPDGPKWSEDDLTPGTQVPTRFADPIWTDSEGRWHYPDDPKDSFRAQPTGQLKSGPHFIDDWRAGQLSDINVHADQLPPTRHTLSADPTSPAGDSVHANERVSQAWYAANDEVVRLETERRAVIDGINRTLDANSPPGRTPKHWQPSDFNSRNLPETLAALRVEGHDPAVVDRMSDLSQKTFDAYTTRTRAVNELGMISARDVAYDHLGDPTGPGERVTVLGDPQAAPKSGELDVIGLRWNPQTGTGHLVVVEAKGGTGDLGSRIVDGYGRVQQGTAPYLKFMLENDPAVLSLLEANPGLREAIQSGAVPVDFVKSTQPLYPRLPGSTPDGRPLVDIPANPEAVVRPFRFGGPPNDFDPAGLWRGGASDPSALVPSGGEPPAGGRSGPPSSPAGVRPAGPPASPGATHAPTTGAGHGPGDGAGRDPATAGGPDLRHAALGHELGGAYHETPDPGATADALRSVLDRPDLLPGGATADPGTGTVRLSLGDGHARAEYPVRFRTAPVGEHDVIADGAHRYAPTAALHFEHDGAVVTLSENASPDHVRQAVASSLAEAQAIADHRFAGTRFDGTSVLVEGAIPAAPDAPRLSPTDLGRLAAMRVVDGDLDAAVAAGDGARADQVRADALGMATRYGLADPPASVFTYGDNRPIVGSDAVGVRHGLIDAHGGGVDAVVHGREGAPARDWGPEIDRLRAADKEHLAQGVRDLVAQRDAADRQLTARLDADGAAGATHLFDRLIIGDGWAATEDFLTLGPEVTGAGPDGLPRVLAIGDHGDPWLRRGVLEMGQVPAELELPGAPFQPGQFAPDGNGFTRSMDFGHAVAAGRALSDMPTYHATATRIEPRPAGDAPGWPDGARYRVHVDGRPPLYARSVDVAAGPGPARIPGSGAHVPPRLVDAGSGYSADLGGSAPVYRDPHGNVVTAADLPAGVPARFGIDPHGAALPGGPHLADGLGRLTDPRLVDAASGYSVDPGTRALYDPAGNGVDAGAVPPDALARLGFGPDGFTDPRPPLRVGDYLVHPGTGDIAHAGDPGARIDPDSLPPDVRARIDGALATQRVQFGGQNMSGDYQPGDRILVYGAGASGAWDIEQAARPALGAHVEWTARDTPGRDPFAGGDNRRNNQPGIGALSDDVRSRVSQDVRNPVEVRATTDGTFLVRFDDGTVREYDRVVFSIGQESTYPGGVESLVRDHGLEPLYGPNRAVDGLRDASGGLRLLGSSGVPGRAILDHVPEDLQSSVQATVAKQADQLPHDSKGVTPAIRNHAGRIADQNRPWNGFQPGVTDPHGLPPAARGPAGGLAGGGAMVRPVPPDPGGVGLAHVRQVPGDPGTVMSLATAVSVEPEPLARQIAAALDSTWHPVVVDGRGLGLTAVAAQAAIALLDPSRVHGRTLTFVVADGSLVKVTVGPRG